MQYSPFRMIILYIIMVVLLKQTLVSHVGQFHFGHQYLMAPEVQFVDHLVQQCKEFGHGILVSLLWFLGEWLDKNTQVFTAQIATFNTAQITIQDYHHRPPFRTMYYSLRSSMVDQLVQVTFRWHISS